MITQNQPSASLFIEKVRQDLQASWLRCRHQSSQHAKCISLMLVGLFFLLGCSTPTENLQSQEAESDRAQATTVAAQHGESSDSSEEMQPAVEYFEDDCPFDESAILDEASEEFAQTELVCSYLIVPEDRSKEDGLSVELAVVTIPSLSDNPQPDPIVYLDGGPGDSALVGIVDWLESPLRNERDIILFDQRGTGYSWPNLDCPETDAFDAGEVPEDLPKIEAIEACRDRLRELGVDLTAYNSAASATDVRDLRHALGLPEWNLFGISYGTRLALTVLRDHPEGVRAVVLDSVYPPNVDAYTEQPKIMADAILALIRSCNADPECGEWYPDLEESLYGAIDTLNEEPLTRDGEQIYGDDLVSMLGSALYDSTLMPLLPYVIDEASFGNYEPWIELEQDGEDEGASRSEFGRSYQDEEGLEDAQGLYYSVECREEAPFGSIEEAEALMEGYAPQLAEPLLAELEEFYAACAIWQVEEAGPIESSAVESDIPTLILNGELDPVTPPSWAILAAETLTNHIYVEVPRGGHSVSSDGDCPMQLIADFLNEPTGTLDSSCVQEVLPFE